ncbi:MAG TPA: Hsp20/alpha crystallin family protein [Pirellulales bacterium]|jgi:HSP20 family protein|nr:Hsp20/alpha crystallin family protein [Pirellulales bacterium]
MAVRRNRFEPLQQLREELDRQFPVLWDTLSGRFPQMAVRSFPALNVWEEQDNLYAEAEVPGFKNEDLEISVVGNELTLKGHRQEVSADKDTVFHRRERGMGTFTRVIRLPVEIEAARVQANLHDGVLLITLPKSEAARPHKVQVQSASG